MNKKTPKLHVAGTTIYLFDSIITQDILHINRLNAAIKIAIENAKSANNKILTIYVDCPDTVIDERFQPTLTDIYNATQSGLNLSICNASNQESTYVRVLESISELSKTPAPSNSPFRKYIKQH